MKKLIPIALVLAMLCPLVGAPVFASEQSILSTAEQSTLSMAGPAAFFVATDGSDTNAGSIDAPFATLAKAQEAARKAGGGVINLRGGTYTISETLSLDERDNNTTFRAYQGEEVTISGAQSIPSSAFTPIADAAVKERIVEKEARDKVLVADLKQLGITDYGTLHYFDLYFGGGSNPALYYNDEMLDLARYPNDGYLNTDKVIDAGHQDIGITATEEQRHPFTMATNDKRLNYWKEANDPWIYGFFMYDYADGAYGVTIDYENGNAITTNSVSGYGVNENRRFYFFNLLEEIDLPGEWYLDREAGLLYLYPVNSIASAKVEFCNFSDSFFNMENVENIRFQGIRMEKSTGSAIVGKNCDNVDIDGCDFTNISNGVVILEATVNSKIRNCHAYHNGSEVFYIEGGDPATLTHSENYVINNHIEDYGRIMATYQSAIDFRGVGATISHNKIHNAPHFAMNFDGQEHVVEYNEIYDVCKDSSDAGAIYSGQTMFKKGNVIRYNYFHDMKAIESNQGMKIQAVYLDDRFCSAEVYGNLFYKVSAVALYGGGRNNTFENNLMLDCEFPFAMDARGTWGGSWSWLSDNQKWAWDKLEELPYKTGVWLERYPELAEMRNDEPDLPKYNVIKNNASYKTPEMDIAPEVNQYSTVENNITLKDTKSFADYKNGDYTVVEGSELLEKIPDWQAIPYEKFGLRTDIDDAAEQSVLLYIGSPRAVALGKQTYVDADNLDVQPVVLEDRTLVPVRFIAESFGAKVGWDGATETVTVQLGDTDITLQIGSCDMTVNGKTTTLDVPAQTINDRTLIPLRAIAESLGKTVFWDDQGLIAISDAELVKADDWLMIDALIRKVE